MKPDVKTEIDTYHLKRYNSSQNIYSDLRVLEAEEE